MLGLVDTQTIFAQPAYVTKLPKYATFEMGSSSVSGSPRAEGGFLTEQDGAKWGAHLGHQSTYQNTFRGTTFQHQDNPVDLLYGAGNWGTSLSLSNSEDMTTDTKQTTVVVRGGMLLEGDQEVAVSVDALGTAEKTTAAVTDKFKTKLPTIEASYLKRMGANVVSATIAYGDGEQTVSNVTSEMKLTGASIGFNHWLQENSLYAGLLLNYASLEVAGKARKVQSLPIVLGFEKEAATWLTLRGSVQQNFLLGSVKDDITPVKEKKNLNDTTVAAGAGMKWGTFTIDALFAASTTGKINGNDFLTQGSLTYWF